MHYRKLHTNIQILSADREPKMNVPTTSCGNFLKNVAVKVVSSSRNSCFSFFSSSGRIFQPSQLKIALLCNSSPCSASLHTPTGKTFFNSFCHLFLGGEYLGLCSQHSFHLARACLIVHYVAPLLLYCSLSHCT